jgi:hypothetical protein
MAAGDDSEAARTLDDGEHARGQDPFGREELERRVALDWVGKNLPYVRRSASGRRPFYWILAIAFVVGLAAYGGGYALRSSATTEPLRFVGDLLYTLGWALWTGVVVVLFLQIAPEAKRRQFKQVLDAYEAAQNEEKPEPKPDPKP